MSRSSLPIHKKLFLNSPVIISGLWTMVGDGNCACFELEKAYYISEEQSQG